MTHSTVLKTIFETDDRTRDRWFIVTTNGYWSPPLKGQETSICDIEVSFIGHSAQDIEGNRYQWDAVENDDSTFHFELINKKEKELARYPDLESITAIHFATKESLRQLESRQPTLINFEKVEKLPAKIQKKFDEIYKALQPKRSQESKKP